MLLLFLLLVIVVCVMAYVGELLHHPRRTILARLAYEFSLAHQLASVREATTHATPHIDASPSPAQIFSAVFRDEVSRLQIKRRRRVLIVDDDKDILVLTHGILRKGGYNIDTAHNGAEALRSLTTTNYDLVLLDLMMPKVGGLEVLEQMGRDPATASIPVVVLTAAEGEARKIDSEQVATVLTKSASPAEILDAVNKHAAQEQL